MSTSLNNIITRAIDVHLMDIKNISSIIYDYIETKMYYFHYEGPLFDDTDEVITINSFILASTPEDAWDVFTISYPLDFSAMTIPKELFLLEVNCKHYKRYLTPSKLKYLNIVYTNFNTYVEKLYTFKD